MIDHVSIAVKNLNTASEFYSRALEPIGLRLLVERLGSIGYGKNYPELWLNERPQMLRQPANSGMHICLRARTVEEVDAFHSAAVAVGGSSESEPALRPHDRVAYYAAFVADLDGNRIEVVTFL